MTRKKKNLSKRKNVKEEKESEIYQIEEMHNLVVENITQLVFTHNIRSDINLQFSALHKILNQANYNMTERTQNLWMTFKIS